MGFSRLNEALGLVQNRNAFMDCFEAQNDRQIRIKTNIKWLKKVECISLSGEDILAAKLARESVE